MILNLLLALSVINGFYRVISQKNLSKEVKVLAAICAALFLMIILVSGKL